MTSPDRNRSLLARGSWPEVQRIGDVLRAETVGGVLLVVAAALALLWANSPRADAYRALGDLREPQLRTGLVELHPAGRVAGVGRHERRVRPEYDGHEARVPGSVGP